ncbi:hypothetical protein GCM10008015_29650 [Flavobacterium palustre]|uniref:Lipoprotein n=1 Tax=Flavobacterium palustre TaxID=1476463 RepID=A0ABQ1HRD0_9FLAO|nr:hypothetical protein [Flavobacterium palustre]GGA87030.1 hypothetical protein GCM10008015_29650 [Flavobacterium palustre]
MQTINSFLKLVYIGLLITSTSCSKEEINLKKESISSVDNLKKNSYKKINSTTKEQFYYYSETNNKKYNHRITGKDDSGKNVKGVINLESEIGIGVIKKEDEITEIEIVSENIYSDKIIATDINGFQYRLKLDDE